ncbi:MAG: SDR family NAD(P)-dependent oxidoreductase, partial [Lentimicrobium sp.]|nr:SDR family NAD(P)-dependent oxidoreductase [Lentimicrobium sp.]
MMSLKGKSALVTGAASGFGFEFSKLLASDGLNLVLIDVNETRLSDARQFLTISYNVSVETMVCDLSRPQSAAEVYSRFQDRNIEILINN